MQIQILIAVFLYLGLMLWIGHKAGEKISSTEDYVFAGRRLPIWLTTSSLFALRRSVSGDEKAKRQGGDEDARQKSVFGNCQHPTLTRNLSKYPVCPLRETSTSTALPLEDLDFALEKGNEREKICNPSAKSL